MRIKKIYESLKWKLINIYIKISKIDYISKKKISPKYPLETLGDDDGNWVIPCELINDNSIFIVSE